eukprot:4526203-Alexandrium_andersonii.AAC.1
MALQLSVRRPARLPWCFTGPGGTFATGRVGRHGSRGARVRAAGGPLPAANGSRSRMRAPSMRSTTPCASWGPARWGRLISGRAPRALNTPGGVTGAVPPPR